MSSPRRLTRRTASSKASDPAATHAVNSPRLCPAAALHVTPRSRSPQRHSRWGGSGQKCWLGDVRAGQQVIGPSRADVGKVDPKDLPGGPEEVSGDWLMLQQLGGHSGALGRLPGEDEGERPIGLHHASTMLAQLSPAPKLESSSLAPRLTRPARTASSRAIGMDAAEVLP